MANPVIVFIAIMVFVYWMYKLATERPKNFPPGPPRLPIWGSYWFILLANYTFLYIFTDGNFWHEQRRFALRYMRDFGFGRRCPSLEAMINEELNDLINLLKNGPVEKDENLVCRDGLIMMPNIFFMAFINSFMAVFSRERWPRSKHHELIKLGRGAMVFQRAGDDMGRALSQTPWLRHIIPEMSGYNDLKRGNKVIYEFIEKNVESIMKQHEDGDDRSFVDIYLNEMTKRQKNIFNKDDETTFSVDQLILTGADFLFPSTTALGVQLCYLFFHLMYRPDVQDKILEELDRVVGRGRLPNLDDRPHMPYTESCLRETMRIETLVPLNLPHRAQTDTSLNGYNIPKNTMVITNLWSIHHDSDIWGDPEVFRPERFLDSRGLLKKKDITLPFGAGKRLCAGETFARQNMFLMFASLVQNFIFSPAPGKEKPPRRGELSGFIISPKDVWIKYQVRYS
ncbi:probable cytochrome P450 304a1 [Ctenocephalides felis]|uniref:probable cytochrome P450 304a1 n=1 Tax=Ctenocephalides felis TaxID=7515 RepID=UPI000E6E22E4|nr:probable cytochrome P450 304a1 [Ctenocephalides felis]